MAIMGSGFSLPVSFYNLHLFGDGARYRYKGGVQETGFYFRDEERFPLIVEEIRTSGAAVVGLAEVWSDSMRAEMQAQLRSEYPYSISSPVGRHGIGRVIEDLHVSWPRLAGWFFGPQGGIVNRFTKSHYTDFQSGILSGLRSYFSETFVPVISQWLCSGPVWGAGLLFLSKYPIISGGFFRHEAKADWEILADKGMIEATIRTGEGDCNFSVGHCQEGRSKRAVDARFQQIRRAREMPLDMSDPSIFMWDFNVPAGSPEHFIMRQILGLAEVQTEDTYVTPNPYQDKLQAPRSEPESQRIDYIYCSNDFEVRNARVLPYWSPRLGITLSDHYAVKADLILHHHSRATQPAAVLRRSQRHRIVAQPSVLV